MSRAMRLVIVGGGGHACVVAEGAELSGWILEGFYDDDPEPRLGRAGVRRLGVIADAARSEHEIILGVGVLASRRRIMEQLGRRSPGGVGCVGGVVTHPRAIVSGGAMLGTGVFVGPGAIVNPGAKIGAHAIINSGAIVEHDCVVGVNAHVAPGAVLCGDVRVGDGTLVGAGSRVIPGVKIGEGCTIGAGSVVVRDVADGATVMGSPAKVRGGEKSVRAVA